MLLDVDVIICCNLLMRKARFQPSVTSLSLSLYHFIITLLLLPSSSSRPPPPPPAPPPPHSAPLPPSFRLHLTMPCPRRYLIQLSLFHFIFIFKVSSVYILPVIKFAIIDLFSYEKN